MGALVATDRPAAPPEAVLIALARKGSGFTIADAAHAAGISVARWSQVENGYETRAGVTRPVRAKPETIARMANAVHVSSDRLAAEGDRPDAVPILREIERGASPAVTLSEPPATGTDFLTAVQDPEAEREQSRAIVDAMIRVPRAEIVAHVAAVAQARGIVLTEDDVSGVDLLTGADLYPGEAGLNPVLAKLWDLKDLPVSERLDFMSHAVLKHPAGKDGNLRSALPARIPEPRSPAQLKSRNVLQ